MNMLIHTLLGALFTAFAVNAQSSAVERAQAEVDLAKLADKSEQPETAALHVRRARAILAEMDVPPAEFVARLDTFARSFDMRETSRTKAIAKATRQLLKVADQYVDKGWSRLAKPILREVGSLDPGAAQPLWDKLRGSRASAGSGALADMFVDGECPWGDGEWLFEHDELVTPKYDKSKYLRISSQRLPFASDKWSACIELAATAEERDACLLFAYRHVEEHIMLRVHSAGRRAHVEMVQVVNARQTVLAEQSVDLTGEEIDGWLKIQVRCDKGNWHARLGEHPEFAAECVAVAPRSFLGLMVQGKAAEHAPARFRNLVLEGLE